MYFTSTFHSHSSFLPLTGPGHKPDVHHGCIPINQLMCTRHWNSRAKGSSSWHDRRCSCRLSFNFYNILGLNISTYYFCYTCATPTHTCEIYHISSASKFTSFPHTKSSSPTSCHTHPSPSPNSNCSTSSSKCYSGYSSSAHRDIPWHPCTGTSCTPPRYQAIAARDSAPL
jgi:hypothetical protein